MQQVVTAGDASNPVDVRQERDGGRRAPDQPGRRHVASTTWPSRRSRSRCASRRCRAGRPRRRCSTTPRSRSSRSRSKPDVKSVLTKVELDEVDAGVVYVTDVKAAGTKVKGVVDPGRRQRLHRLPDRPVSKSANAATAQAFVAYVAVPRGPERADRGRVREALTADPGRSTVDILGDAVAADARDRARRVARGGGSRSAPAPAAGPGADRGRLPGAAAGRRC